MVSLADDQSRADPYDLDILRAASDLDSITGTQAFPQPPDVVDFEPTFLSLTSDLLP